MKGPGLRVNLDVRRLWQCPLCGAERRAAASVTALRCGCTPERPRMRLVEVRRHVRPEPKPLDLVLDIDPDAPDAEAPDETAAPAPAPAAPEVVAETEPQPPGS
jgi:hypothetical protein